MVISLSSLDKESIKDEITLHEFVIDDYLEQIRKLSQCVKNHKSLLRILKKVLNDERINHFEVKNV